MHKFIQKLFNGSKSLLQFLKILDVFFIMLLLLYWTMNLIGSKWGWIEFFKPVLDSFISVGKLINDGSIMLFAAVFEYKYFIALILFLAVYAIIHFLYMAMNGLENTYDAGRVQFKKFQEKNFNNNLEIQQTNEQKRLQNYLVYISIKIKNEKKAMLNNINLEEQEKMMNKFLMEQTGVSPIKFEEGFLYEFSKFDYIDSVLGVFFKVLKSGAPVNYQICMLMREGDKEKEHDRLIKLISLKFINKISTLSNVIYRYKFVDNSKYETSQLGLFQKDNETFEVHEFIEGI